MIEERTSENLFDVAADALVNPVNCKGVMGKGIALEFRRRYPRSYGVYRDACASGELTIGAALFVPGSQGERATIHFPTKRHWKGRSRLEWIRRGLAHLREHYTEWGLQSIAMPQIGCGLGGLEWANVRQLISDELGGEPLQVIVCIPAASELDTVSSGQDKVSAAGRQRVKRCHTGRIVETGDLREPLALPFGSYLENQQQTGDQEVRSKYKIILPLDVDNAEKAVALVTLLKDDVGAFKIGLELVNAAGLDVFEMVTKAGASRIFYDCKFHDIPNTVAGASRAAARLGVWMFNVHCAGGSAMMKAAKDAAVEAAVSAGRPCPLVIGVTVLTSIDAAVLNDEMRVSGSVADQVVHLALLAREAGLDGVVASPHEIGLIRRACGPGFLIVTPGVRPAGADIGDQKRVMTPAEAVAKGADYLVIGRPIIKADDPKAAARTISVEITG